jgi:hypothetical protein
VKDPNSPRDSKFSLQTLPPNPIPAGGVTFPVNKTSAHMGFYFYQIGASAALGDLDGDGLPNDLCLTDVRAKNAMGEARSGYRRPIRSVRARLWEIL